MSERAIQNAILIAAGAHGLTLWRNNTGQAWAGAVTKLRDGSIQITNPRPLHAGLCKGSADLIGLRRIVITADMVGQTIAQFVAIEVKQPGRAPTPEQRRFLDFVRERGGCALVASAPEDLP